MNLYDLLYIDTYGLRVVVLRGPSGAGKSTFAKWCESTRYNTFVVSADHFFTRESGEYVFDKSKLGLAHSQCFANFLKVLRTEAAGFVIVDNTNTESWQISPYILAAQAHSLEYRIVELGCDMPANVLAQHNIHGVDERTIQRQLHNLSKPLPMEWRKHVVRIRKYGFDYTRDE